MSTNFKLQIHLKLRLIFILKISTHEIETLSKNTKNDH